MNKIDKESGVKVVVSVILVAIIGISYLIKPDAFAIIWYLTISGDISGTIEYLRSAGLGSIVISLIIGILVNVVGFLPSIFISTANGIVFGIGPGILISWIAETIGVIISFILMRTALRGSAEELIKKSNMLKKIDEFSGSGGFKMMLVARTVPYFPSGLITALGAVSRIRFKDYVLANLIGKFPATALEVIVGYDIVNYKQNMMQLTLVVIAITFAYGLLWWYNKRKLAKG